MFLPLLAYILLKLFVASTLAIPVRKGPAYTFERAYPKLGLGTSIQYIKNPIEGIIKTSHYSGYVNFDSGDAMFFWLFEAQHDPNNNAPLVASFGGGPGFASSSQSFETGPLGVVEGRTADGKRLWLPCGLENPNLALNSDAHVIYIDQPFGAGFSYGPSKPFINEDTVAAQYVWKALQTILEAFSAYQSRGFGISTESYGGHSGPAIAGEILSQNTRIKKEKEKKTNKHHEIMLKSLAIAGGIYDGNILFESYIEHAKSYTFNAQDQSVFDDAKKELVSCKTYLSFCESTHNGCRLAYEYCRINVERKIRSIVVRDRDPDNMNWPANLPPPLGGAHVFGTNPNVVSQLGARTSFAPQAWDIFANFVEEGTLYSSILPTLSGVLDKGVAVIMYVGMADWKTNWYSSDNAAEALTWPGQTRFQQAKYSALTMGGKFIGSIKAVEESGSYLAVVRVNGAGHSFRLSHYNEQKAFFNQAMLPPWRIRNT